MGQYVIRRLLLLIPVLLGVTLMTFILTNLLPGDPARSLAGKYATPEQIQETRERLGLDQPLHIQYLRYLGRLVQGDLGKSIQSRQPIVNDLKTFFPPTLELTLAAMTLTVLVGIPIGVISGAGRSPWVNSLLILMTISFRHLMYQ